MKPSIIALVAACLFTPALHAASDDAGAEPSDANSYCAQMAAREQVPNEERAEYVAECIADRREALQSDEGDAIGKGAGND